jgi:hypothetical protein
MLIDYYLKKKKTTWVGLILLFLEPQRPHYQNYQTKINPLVINFTSIKIISQITNLFGYF